MSEASKSDACDDTELQSLTWMNIGEAELPNALYEEAPFTNSTLIDAPFTSSTLVTAELLILVVASKPPMINMLSVAKSIRLRVRI